MGFSVDFRDKCVYIFVDLVYIYLCINIFILLKNPIICGP